LGFGGGPFVWIRRIEISRFVCEVALLRLTIDGVLKTEKKGVEPQLLKLQFDRIKTWGHYQPLSLSPERLVSANSGLKQRR
jgi:hypothetical protein